MGDVLSIVRFYRFSSIFVRVLFLSNYALFFFRIAITAAPQPRITGINIHQRPSASSAGVAPSVGAAGVVASDCCWFCVGKLGWVCSVGGVVSSGCLVCSVVGVVSPGLTVSPVVGITGCTGGFGSVTSSFGLSVGILPTRISAPITATLLPFESPTAASAPIS